MGSSFAVVGQAVEEQATGGAQMLSALQSVQETTGQVEEGAGLIHQQSTSVHREMEKLEQISQEVTDIVHKMRIASGSIGSFLENAKALAQHSE